MGLVGQVVHGPPVAEMDVVDDPELLQRVERAVDGREVDVGVRPLDGGGEVVGGEVVVLGRGQGSEQASGGRSSPGPRGPAAGRNESVEAVLTGAARARRLTTRITDRQAPRSGTPPRGPW